MIFLVRKKKVKREWYSDEWRKWRDTNGYPPEIYFKTSEDMPVDIRLEISSYLILSRQNISFDLENLFAEIDSLEKKNN